MIDDHKMEPNLPRNLYVLPCPSPVPNHLNCSQTVIELQITSSVLLGAGTPANIAAIESKIRDEATAAVFRENSNVRCVAPSRSFWHIEYKILQGSSLRYLPVDTSGHLFFHQHCISREFPIKMPWPRQKSPPHLGTKKLLTSG